MPAAIVGEVNRIHNNIEFEWRVSDFISLTDDESTTHELRSPDFKFANSSWHFDMETYGKDDKEYEGYIGIYLTPDEIFHAVFPVTVTYTFYLKRTNGVIQKKRKATHTFTEETGRGWPCFIKRSQLLSETSDLVPSGILTLFCNVVEGETKNTQSADILLQDLKRMYMEKENCDAVLKVGGKEFNAHRAILAARSPVFSSMFKHDSEEKISGKVDIPDCSAAAFKVFLLYLYTATVDTISPNNVCEVYCTADKYQVTQLKSECVEYMIDNLSNENFCFFMTLSLQHNESELQEEATIYFCDNVKAIIKTVQWKEFLRTYPTEANELYIKAIKA